MPHQIKTREVSPSDGSVTIYLVSNRDNGEMSPTDKDYSLMNESPTINQEQDNNSTVIKDKEQSSAAVSVSLIGDSYSDKY